MTKSHGRPRRAGHSLKSLFDGLSGEWILQCLAPYNNAGWIILLRAIWVTGAIVVMLEFCALIAWVVDQWNSPFLFRWPPLPDGLSGMAAFAVARIRSISRSYGTELLGVFGGVCAAFYSRFASQWQYLADLYNQIKAQDIALAVHFHSPRPSAIGPAGTTPTLDSKDVPMEDDPVKDPRDLLAELMTGFIVDAFTLHLARKPLFRTVIEDWAGRKRVSRLLEERDPSDDIRKEVQRIVAEEQAGTGNCRLEG